ncbi:hypothetical protein RXV86_12930 [Alisedimentitalea sp. MJ-SS2]|uniref:lipopolysaccharide biosynthesis protein n=1 Tax=Aliisedimentitalea sp. MJ-SS2 TaxID=3049795 RepID=UPI00290D6869|nr:hypothetical protein [Alisedimentitalea sp. MJ-SS2]MDU8928293.1 hypothetical protein [Alisedimentitalea sp. MJ-SS2]
MAKLKALRQRFPGIASILGNGAFLAGTQWSEAVLRGIYVLVISRWLGAEYYGVWSYTTTTYAFALGLALFGLESIVPLRLGRNLAATTFLSTAFWLRFGLLGLAAVALTAGAFVFEGDVFIQLALLLVIPALIGRGIVLFARSALLALNKSYLAFRLAVCCRIMEVVAGLVSLWLGAGLFTLLIVHSVSWLMEAGFTLLALSRQITFRLQFDFGEFGNVLREGAVHALVAISIAVLTAMPLIYIRHKTDDLALVGQMGLAIQVASLVVMGAAGVLGAALPVVARASTRGDARLRHYPAFVALGSAIVFGAAIIFAQVFGHSIAITLLGSGFASTGTLLAPALLAGGLMVLPAGAWQLHIAQDRSWCGALAGWAGVLTLFVALPPLARSSGASGALVAASLALGVRAIVLFTLGVGKRS